MTLVAVLGADRLAIIILQACTMSRRLWERPGRLPGTHWPASQSVAVSTPLMQAFEPTHPDCLIVCPATGLRKAGVDVPGTGTSLLSSMNPEDFWSPTVEPPQRGAAFVEQVSHE